MKCEFLAIVALLLACAMLAGVIYQDQTMHKRIIGVTAECNNGRYTTAPRSQGVCSSNDGVKRWIE